MIILTTAAVVVAGSVGAAATGVMAAWSGRRSSEVTADLIAGRVVGNARLGGPYTAALAGPSRMVVGELGDPGAGTGPACPGRLDVHQDGALSCHGGRHDCLGTNYSHAHRQDCRHGYGCGRCDNPPAGAVPLDPAPARAEGDDLCARCGIRSGSVLVAGSDSLPTEVCERCAGLIAAGASWNGVER